jgi:hypothetical protein
MYMYFDDVVDGTVKLRKRTPARSKINRRFVKVAGRQRKSLMIKLAKVKSEIGDLRKRVRIIVEKMVV